MEMLYAYTDWILLSSTANAKYIRTYFRLGQFAVFIYVNGLN